MLVAQLLEADGAMYQGVNSSAIAKARRYYRVCMNQTATKQMGGEPLSQVSRLTP